jgi:biopolymer transport protein ExbD
MGAARIVTRTLKPWNLAASALSTLTACSVPRIALCAEAPTVLVTLDEDAGENGLCHVHYKEVNRTALCTEIVALMQSEASIPAHAHVTLRGSKTARYVQVSQLLQSLRVAGYNMKLGYITSQ